MPKRRTFLAAAILSLAALSGAASLEAQDRSPLRRLFGQGSASAPDRDAAAGDRIRSRSPGGPKRVEIDLTTQTLRAYEGRRLVMQSRISSGRGRITPTGSFTAGPYMAENHYSSLFNNAHMPWSVQVTGNIFIHGFAEVPDYPASRGCIRLPITGDNPAKRFYHWVEAGTPIRIFRS